MEQSPTFAGLGTEGSGPIGSEVTSPSESGSESVNRQSAIAMAAAAAAAAGNGNAFGLTGVAQQLPQPPTMVDDAMARKGTLATSDWMRYLAAHELAHPTYAKSFRAPTTLADGTEMRGSTPSPYIGGRAPLTMDVEMATTTPSFGRGPSPYESIAAPSPPGSSCASHPGYGSSGGDSNAGGSMFNGAGPLRPQLNGFRPPSTSSSVFTRDRASLSSSLQTEVSAGSESWKSGKNAEDPTLASADLARSRSSNPGVPYSFEGLQATAPGIPHLGMPNSLSFLAFGDDRSVVDAREGPKAPQQSQSVPTGAHLGEAVDGWRRAQHRPPTLDGSSAASGEAPVFRGVNGHSSAGNHGMFLPLLDHDTTPNASAPASANGYYERLRRGSATLSGMPDFDRAPSAAASAAARNGFFRAEPQTSVQILHTPDAMTDYMPPDHTRLQPQQAGMKDAYRTSPWPLTPGASPPSAVQTQTVAEQAGGSAFGRIEDASAARDSMRIDLEDLVAVELAA